MVVGQTPDSETKLSCLKVDKRVTAFKKFLLLNTEPAVL